VGEDWRALLPAAGWRWRGRGPLRRCHEGGACSVAVAPATATGEDSAMGQIFGSVPARRSFGAADATLNVFNLFIRV
jgi:hypothetical protein